MHPMKKPEKSRRNAGELRLPGKKEDKDKLVAEVSGRILSGESQIAAQDIDSVVGPVRPEPVVPH